MLLRRLATSLRRQDWVAVAIEFTIVVVGILVGLQINDWNQQRLDRAESFEQLRALNAELEMQAVTYERSKFNGERWLEHVYFLEAVIADPTVAGREPNRLGTALIVSAYLSSLPIPTSVFDELERSGQIGDLPDRALITALRSHYADLDLWQEVHDAYNVPEEWARAKAGFLSVSEMKAFMTSPDYENTEYPELDGVRATRIATELSASEAFRRGLPEIAWYHLGAINLAERQLEAVRALKAEVEAVLAEE